LISILALIGYAYGVQSLYRVVPFSSMAVHTAFTFCVLSLGILFAQPERGIVALLLRESVGGILARRLLLPTFIIPIVVGWLRLEAERVGHFTTEFGAALLVTVTIATFLTLVLWVVRPLDRADTERQRNEEHFHQVIERAPSGMVMIDQADKIVLVNAQIEQAFGYSRNELLGQPIELLVPERFRRQHTGYRNGFAAQPETRVMGAGRDLYGQRKDGSTFPVEIGLNPIQTAQGMMILSTVADITERKRAEELLRQAAEDRFAKIFQASPIPMSIVRVSDRRVIETNESFCRLIGLTREEVINKTGPELGFTSDAAKRDRYYNELAGNLSVRDVVDFFRFKTGEKTLLISAESITLNGEACILWTTQDITERKLAEERFVKAFHANPTPLGIVRVHDRKFVEVNESFLRLSGLTHAEVIGKTSLELGFTTDSGQRESHYEAIAATGKIRNQETLYRFRTGEKIVLTSAEVITLNGEACIMWSNQDITERKRAEERFVKAFNANPTPLVIVRVRDRQLSKSTKAS
jgi:PAS domain S-box-containing protein